MGYNVCCFQIKVKIKENESTQKLNHQKSSTRKEIIYGLSS